MALPVAQAAPAAPAPEALGSALGITCVLSIGDECDTTLGATGGLFYLAGLILAICLAAGAACFAASFYFLRRAFQKASGGLSFKAGGLRG